MGMDEGLLTTKNILRVIGTGVAIQAGLTGTANANAVYDEPNATQELASQQNENASLNQLLVNSGIYDKALNSNSVSGTTYTVENVGNVGNIGSNSGIITVEENDAEINMENRNIERNSFEQRNITPDLTNNKKPNIKERVATLMNQYEQDKQQRWKFILDENRIVNTYKEEIPTKSYSEESSYNAVSENSRTNYQSNTTVSNNNTTANNIEIKTTDETATYNSFDQDRDYVLIERNMNTDRNGSLYSTASSNQASAQTNIQAVPEEGINVAESSQTNVFNVRQQTPYNYTQQQGYTTYTTNNSTSNTVSNNAEAQPVLASNVSVNDDLNKEMPLLETNASIEKNNGVFVNDDSNVVDMNTLQMLDRFNRPAPLWTCEVLYRLAGNGLLYPDGTDIELKSMNRREGAILTARSYNLYRNRLRAQNNDMNNGNNTRKVSQFNAHDIDMLIREFEPEVRALGYNIIDEVTDTKVIYQNEWDWTIGGEIRYSFARNTGASRYTWSDNRIRARIYAEKAISDNWKIHGMIEADKSNIFDETDDAVGNNNENDGKVEFNRIYLEGNYNWWDIPFNIEIGKTYAYLADGNVLDSDFKGIKVSASPTPFMNYRAGYGKVNSSEKMYYLEAFNQNENYDYLGGYYHWNNYDSPVNIYALGVDYHTGNFTFGGMYLRSDLADGSGAKDGYVLTARYGKNFAWIPHTYEFALKYYNMAGHTYINHTMNGVGNYMDGFTGWGAMYYYTIVENLLFGLHYYDLKDKTTNEKGKTIWAELSWSF